MRIEILTDVPTSDRKQTEGDFRDDGADHVESKQQQDGNWTVVAVFLEDEDNADADATDSG